MGGAADKERGRTQPACIYLWVLPDQPEPSEGRLWACARAYAETAGREELAAVLTRRPAMGRSEKGKPFFVDLPDLHFSLSHSGNYGACAFYHQPVGLDLQTHSSCDRKAIARRFFHPEEYAYLEVENFIPFFQVWAAKEGYVKYTGEGISGGLHTFSVADHNGLKRAIYDPAHKDNVEFRHFETLPNYSMCLCAPFIPEVIIALDDT